ncbi:hypothetical protein C8Q76DRAFT_572502, partial [Earliella scabrosa]
LPSELENLFTDLLDLPSLIAWRGVCRTTYERVETTLQSALQRIISHYLPIPGLFMASMDSYRAIIVGHAALAFLLRDQDVLSDVLEISVGTSQAEDLQHDLVESQALVPVPDMPTPPNVRDRASLFRTPNQRYVRLLVSPSDNPLVIVAQTHTTALVNYVSSKSFGCAYPAFTLNRLALFPGMKAGQDDHGDNDITHGAADPDPDLGSLFALAKCGFWFSNTPESLVARLDGWTTPERCSVHTAPYLCFRRTWLCPEQFRHFGDQGSFVALFDTAHVSPERLAEQKDAPFASTV